MQRVIGLSDVARRAGVSVSVVSRVLNGDPALRARDDTRDRVRQAARDLNYTPNHAARALRMSQAGAVALVVPDVTSAMFAEVMRGVEESAEAAGIQVLLVRSERLPSGSDHLRRLMGEGRVDGFLLQRADDSDESLLDAIAEGSMPVVLINSRGRGRGSAVLDDGAGAQAAVEHLVALGHRAIGYIGAEEHSYAGKQSEQGFSTALQAAGQRPVPAWMARLGTEPEAGRLSIHQFFSGGGARPTAVVVADVKAAVGVLEGARQLGLRVPEDLSVVSIHDTWVAEFSSPPLTTIRMPLYELGRAALRQLLARLEGSDPADDVVLDPDPELVRRGSTTAPRQD